MSMITDLLFFRESEQVQRFDRFLEIGQIVDAGDDGAVALTRVMKLFLVAQFQVAHRRQAGSSTQLIEDVVVSFAGRLEHDARLFQQVGAHSGALDGVLVVETQFAVFAETGTVVVARRFRIAYRLQPTKLCKKN